MLKKYPFLLVFSMKMRGPIRRMTVLALRVSVLKHMCACCEHTRSFERTHGDVLNGYTGVTHRDTRTHTLRYTENMHTQDPNRTKTTILRTKKSIFLTHRKCQLHKVTFSKCPSPVDPRGCARLVRHGRTMWPENACGASDGVIHSTLIILRVEPSCEGKDILHIPQYQLNLRHLSSTAAVSTQNLDLPDPGHPLLRTTAPPQQPQPPTTNHTNKPHQQQQPQHITKKGLARNGLVHDGLAKINWTNP